MKKTILFFVFFIALATSVMAGFGEGGFGEGGFGESASSSPPPTSSSSSSTGGGGSSGATSAVMTLNKPITRFLVKGKYSTLTLDGIRHQFRLTKITNDTVTIEFKSEPVIANFSLGEYGYVDLDRDNINDLKIKVLYIRGNTARLEIIYISEKTEDSFNITKETDKLIEEIIKKQTEETEEPTVEEVIETVEVTEEKKSNAGIIIGVLLLLVIAAMIIFLMTRKKGKSDESVRD